MYRAPSKRRPKDMVGGVEIHPHFLQDNDWGCGPCALATAMSSLGIWTDPLTIAKETRSETLQGTSTGLLMSAARRRGLKASGNRGVGYGRLKEWVVSPDHAVIGYLASLDHWVVIPWVWNDGLTDGIDEEDQEVTVIDSLDTSPYLAPWDHDFGYYALVLRRTKDISSGSITDTITSPITGSIPNNLPQIPFQ